jgi:hypothetical protein
MTILEGKIVKFKTEVQADSVMFVLNKNEHFNLYVID